MEALKPRPDEPWSPDDPVIKRLVAHGLQLPEDRTPPEFPHPPVQATGPGLPLSQELVEDRRG